MFLLNVKSYSQDKLSLKQTDSSKYLFSGSKRLYTIGLYGAVDAEGVYFGPAGKASIYYYLKAKFGLGIMLHFFQAQINNPQEKGYLWISSVGVMGQVHLGKSRNKGFYTGFGICQQQINDDYKSTSVILQRNQHYFVPAFCIGYSFYALKRKRNFSFEIFGTGPYSEKDGVSAYTEILTQLSAGITTPL